MNYIAYLRVSSKDQGDSMLGLESQKRDVESFVQRREGRLIFTFQEIESGTGKNAANRPVLDEAIAKCKEHDATLVIAKIDRLYRNVYFISKLKHDGLKFISLDNEHANTTTLYVLAAMAEEEANRISQRTKNALASIKERIKKDGKHISKKGNVITKLGSAENFTEEGRKNGGKSTKQKFDRNPRKKRAKLVISKMMGDYSAEAIAQALNDNDMKSVKGGKWSMTTVYRLMREIKEEREQKMEMT